MARDPLRSTLDNLKVDPEASSDRPYLEAALRRMGYTESEIRERLGEPAPADRPTEYRLVKPVIATGSRSASPFEELQRGELDFEGAAVEFDAVEATNTEFQEVPVDGDQAYDITFEQIPEPKEGLLWDEVQTQEELPAEDAALLEEAAASDNLPVDESSDAPDFALDTFGSTGGDGAAPRTRVRVRRVRAGSRQEAEAKVAGQGRRVIKSIPVDIVERWGPGESTEKGAR